jgi:anti-anti-sigma factor
VPNQDAVVWYLRVAQERTKSVIVLTASGRVSSLTVGQLKRALAAAAAESVGGVVLDLSGVDYISSPGLRAVEETSNRLAADGRRLVLCGVIDAVRLALGLAGLESALTIEASRESAVGAAALDTSSHDA